MKRRNLSLSALGALTWLAMPLATAATGEPSRALWTWEAESYAMVEDPAVAEEAIVFLKRNGIDTLYLYADAFKGRNLIAERPELYRAFITRMHASGLRAFALLGSAYLNTETYILPTRRADAEAMFRRVIDYNRAAPLAARFDGVNLDIEPHLLDEWSDNTRHQLMRHFLDMSAALMKIKRDSNASLSVGPAIPFWLDGIELEWQGRRRPVSEHVIDVYDYVALMDYRDKAEGRDGILSHAEQEIAYANRVGKRVVIGLETTKNDLNKVTFYEEGPKVMEREMAKVTQALRNEPSFAGFALHHYRAWRNWLKRPWP